MDAEILPCFDIDDFFVLDIFLNLFLFGQVSYMTRFDSKQSYSIDSVTPML